MALITKILETTLAAGATSVTFNDADIPNSLIRVFATNSNIYPLNISLSGNILTVTYEAQSSSMGVALELVKQGLEVIDGVSSTAADKALSANQGKILNDNINTVSGDLSDLSNTVSGLVIPDEITDLSDVNVSSIQDGQVLAWDAVSQKFVNVNQSGGSSEIYTTDEQLIGTYLGENLYRKVIPITQDWAFVANTWVKSNIPQGSIKSIINGRLQVTYGGTFSLHFIQLGFIDSMIAGNCYRAFSAAANGANLIIEYTKTA